MAQPQDLHIRLANGSEHVVSLQDGESPVDAMAEIITRTYANDEPVEYEWLPTVDKHWIRVEAIDVIWTTDEKGDIVVPSQDVPDTRDAE